MLLKEAFMKAVWVNGHLDDMNITVAFRTRIGEGHFRLKLAASNTYRVMLNDEFLAYGPFRSAHGYSNIATYDFENLRLSGGFLTVEVASYNIDTYYTVKEKPFFACELFLNGKKIADADDFDAYLLNDRVKKVPKYSFQRPHCECYEMKKDRSKFYLGSDTFPILKKISVLGNKLLENELVNPDFERIPINKIIESGEVYLSEDYFKYQTSRFYPTKSFTCYEKDELEIDLVEKACRLSYKMNGKSDYCNRYDLYEMQSNRTGFVCLEVTVYKDSEVYILFDEILFDEVRNNPSKDSWFIGEKWNPSGYYTGSEKPLIFWRFGTISVVLWKLKIGRYKIMTCEPYTMKYLKTAVLGSAKVTPSFITYDNPSVKLNLCLKDEKLQKIFDAAINTFRQNSVDILTDCPSRERAGWLCDSYFIGRTETAVTGTNKVERNMLLSYLLSPQSEYLPDGMLPMCYPADHSDGNYILNWSLWLIIQLNDYAIRSGDRELTAAFKKRLNKLLNFIARFENEYGLLEKVDKWVFIEWSKANDFTMDVNYPSNMLYYGALKCMARLYGDHALSEKAARIKEIILQQSFDGEFFVDNAVRRDGVLVPTQNTTETCQYYAFYFDIVSPESHPELYRIMFDTIEANKNNSSFLKLHKSNAFIGNYLRLDYLAKRGRYAQLINECGDRLLYMAQRTGTLWEDNTPRVSCNHGFASLAAVWIMQAISGFSHVDESAKIIYFSEPYVKIDASGEIPLRHGTVKFRTENGRLIISKAPTSYLVRNN